MSFNPISGYDPPDPDPARFVHREPSHSFNLADPDPDRTFLGVLNRELMAAAEREKQTRADLEEHQAKADSLTRARVAIERAINAYQGQTSDNSPAYKAWANGQVPECAPNETNREELADLIYKPRSPRSTGGAHYRLKALECADRILAAGWIKPKDQP